MKVVYEIFRDDVRKYGIEGCLEKGQYTVWDSKRIRGAFNFGNGTMKDFERFKRDNKKYCIFLEMEER